MAIKPKDRIIKYPVPWMWMDYRSWHVQWLEPTDEFLVIEKKGITCCSLKK